MKNDGESTKSAAGGVSLRISRPVVVRKDSGITRVQDLEGKKVGVGSVGSGAFANCELLFTHLGVWDEIKRNAMGYNDADLFAFQVLHTGDAGILAYDNWATNP